MPGQHIYKDPTVTNAGTDDVYLRVKLEAPAGLLEALQSDFGLKLNPAFVLAADGYYYYSDEQAAPQAFTPGTSALFFLVLPGAQGSYSMTVPKAWTGREIEGFLQQYGTAQESLALTITAEAVQARGFEMTVPWQGVVPQAVVSTQRRTT